ncbi:MAG: CocE/NonD family hydrolase [Rariglobus sp.]
MIASHPESSHVEPVETSQAERVRLLDNVNVLLEKRREAARAERARYFRPDASSPERYERSLATYREDLIALLGWPLNEPTPPISAEVTEIANDEMGRIQRVHVGTVAGLKAYGILFLPPGPGKHPLVIAQHGGHGSPELAAGFWPEAPSNYNGMITRLRERGAAVFAPQLIVWDRGQDPKFDQHHMDRKFRHLGGSRAAFDLCQLRDLFAWLVTHPEIDADRIGMTGLSYGGFYSLVFAALEPRIRVAVSSCFVNDRHRYDWEDWVWTGSAKRFLDGEIARMICPRPLFLEAGARDELFDAEGFGPVAGEVSAAYRALGRESAFESRLHPGGHEYDPDGRAGEFLLKWL